MRRLLNVNAFLKRKFFNRVSCCPFTTSWLLLARVELPGGCSTTSSMGGDMALGPAALIPMQEKLPWK